MLCSVSLQLVNQSFTSCVQRLHFSHVRSGYLAYFFSTNVECYSIKIGTLGVHVSALRNCMVAMKKISLTIVE
jgi:hypothetical protein